MRRAVHVVVSGRVQGVGYRDWCRGEAVSRGVSGWVRNRRDGSVEAVLAGAGAEVSAILAALRTGPPAARVAEVAVADWSGAVAAAFTILPTD